MRGMPGRQGARRRAAAAAGGGGWPSRPVPQWDAAGAKRASGKHAPTNGGEHLPRLGSADQRTKSARGPRSLVASASGDHCPKRQGGAPPRRVPRRTSNRGPSHALVAAVTLPLTAAVRGHPRPPVPPTAGAPGAPRHPHTPPLDASVHRHPNRSAPLHLQAKEPTPPPLPPSVPLRPVAPDCGASGGPPALPLTSPPPPSRFCSRPDSGKSTAGTRRRLCYG